MVSIELRESSVTALADVVFPIAPVVEKAGSFVNWEGRLRPFEPSLTSNAFSDLRVLQTLADDLGMDLGFRTAEAAAPRSPAWALGWDARRGARCPATTGPVARQATRWCWPAGECCWTTAGYRTASRIWRAPRGPRWWRLSARTAAGIGAAAATWSRCRVGAARSPCRW